jgi:hypothetical protein
MSYVSMRELKPQAIQLRIVPIPELFELVFRQSNITVHLSTSVVASPPATPGFRTSAMAIYGGTTAAARPAPTRCGRFERLVNG